MISAKLKKTDLLVSNDTFIYKLEEQSNRFTSNDNNKPIVIGIGKNSLDEYKISYAFDRTSLKEISEILNITKSDKDFLSIYKLLKNILSKAKGKEIAKEKDDIFFSDFTKKVKIITCKTKEQLISIFTSIKEQLETESLTKASNIGSLDIEHIIDHSSKNFKLYKSFEDIMSWPAQEIPEEDMVYFKYKNIISLANGYCYADDCVNLGSTDYLVESFFLTPKVIKITATDISYAAKPQYVKVENDNLKIKIMKLDNTKNFLEQNVTEKFDLVLMKSGLCYCGYNRSEDNPTCSGVKIYQPQMLKNFLVNVSSIMDIDKPYSKAIMTGSIYHEPRLLENEIQEFNNENNKFIAEIIRNHTGVFIGIMIHFKPTDE